MDIRAAEISAILKDQIANFGTEAEIAEVGRVLSVGDGIARVYGLDEVQAGEMVEFEDGTRGMALNLEERQRRHRHLRRRPQHLRGRHGQADQVDRRRAGAARSLLGRVVDGLGNPIDGKGPIEATERRIVDVKAPGIMPRKSVHEPMQTGLKAIDAPDPDRPRPARADHRRPPDRQDRDRDRRLHQPEALQRRRPRTTSKKLYLHLRRHRPEALVGGQAGQDAAGQRRPRILASSSPPPPPTRRRCSSWPPTRPAPWASISATTACTR